MKSEDEHFTDAIFFEKAKARLASVHRPAANKENVNVIVEVSEESSDEEASDEDSESVSDSHETSSHQDNRSSACRCLMELVKPNFSRTKAMLCTTMTYTNPL